MREFGLAPSDLGLLTSAYFLAFGLAQLPVGVLLDRYGPRRVVATLLCVTGARRVRVRRRGRLRHARAWRAR